MKLSLNSINFVGILLYENKTKSSKTLHWKSELSAALFDELESNGFESH